MKDEDLTDELKQTKTYKLTGWEMMLIAENELPQEAFFQDGELTLPQAKENLEWLKDNERISRITYDYYKKWESIL